MKSLDPDIIASTYRDDLRAQIRKHSFEINLVGYLVSADKASRTYAEYTRSSCESIGVHFTLIQASPDEIGDLIRKANNDDKVHGIFVYYPIFGDTRDSEIKDLIDPTKDVEGLSSHWLKKLYANDRFDGPGQRHKALLPCTPLAIMKLLEETDLRSKSGLPFKNRTVTIFNRSEVVGRPLAYMLTNDGARVFSFDAFGGLDLVEPESKKIGIDREMALKMSDVVITGVPSRDFKKVTATEIRPGTICLNFSSLQNFEDDAKEKAGLYIPRVGPLTVAMCLRNAVRLFENYYLSRKAAFD
jgi:methylenetetrahydrofolate dehydrogenase (NADP+)/methenyltetrahydrofolate cyclohydrolase